MCFIDIYDYMQFKSNFNFKGKKQKKGIKVKT
jgi:hypothetical protein